MITATDRVNEELHRRMGEISRIFGLGVLVHGGGWDDTRPAVFRWSMIAR
jgi:hypothetical protein